MNTELICIVPVLPSSNIGRDIDWYNEKTGFISYFSNDMYAVLYKKNLFLHLQWHANTADDPLLHGSVIRIVVKNIQPIFEDFIKRDTIAHDAMKLNTPWETIEFGFYT